MISHDVPLNSLSFCARAKNVFCLWDIKTVGDLLNYTQVELLRIPRLGKTTINNIVHVLARHDLSLRPYDPAVEYEHYLRVKAFLRANEKSDLS